MRQFPVLLVVLTLALAVSASADAGIVVAGSATSGLTDALDLLAIPYTTDGGFMPDPGSLGLGAGDILILGFDGGTGPFFDYNPFLNSGGHLIVAGGSNFEPYRTWAAGYFNTTDTGSGWHTDGTWLSVGIHPANSLVPATFAFGDTSITFHMLAFLPTTNTTIYGAISEGVDVGAFRTYGTGSFNYMALDLGQYGSAGDISDFTAPWVQSAVNATNLAPIPEPSTWALFGLGAVGVATWTRRRKRRPSA